MKRPVDLCFFWQLKLVVDWSYLLKNNEWTDLLGVQLLGAFFAFEVPRIKVDFIPFF